METVQEPSIDDMSNQIRLAVKEGRVEDVDDLPREAFVQAAWQSTVARFAHNAIWGGRGKTKSLEWIEQDCIKLLTPEEKLEASELAENWLNENWNN